MENRTKTSLRDSVATRILLVVLGFYLLIAIVVSLSHVMVEYKYQQANITQDLGDIEDAFADALAVSLWGLDEDALNASVSGMLKIPTLVGVEVAADNGATVAIGGNVTLHGKTGNVGFHVDLHGITDERLMIHEDELYTLETFKRKFPVNFKLEDEIIHLGEATVYSNSSVILRRMKLQVAMLATNVVLTLLTFILALTWTVNRYLRKPLRILTNATADIAVTNLGSFSVDTKASGNNEIKVLEETMTSMIADLHDAISKREETENALKVHADRLEGMNESLTLRNQELDEFTYIASHDLQEPLRKINAFSGLLKHDLGDELSVDAKENFDFLMDAATRMQTLVNDLLVLSRSGRREINKQDINVGECADDAIDALAVLISETGAKITRDELPDVKCDKTTVTQLYQNLIGNAIKFVDDKVPQIRLTAENTPEGVVLGVADNGIGIEEQYQEQIFTPFKKLHGRDKYSGTGIGLSICKKTIAKHNGRIWIESKLGTGSHFKFTL